MKKRKCDIERLMHATALLQAKVDDYSPERISVSANSFGRLCSSHSNGSPSKNNGLPEGGKSV
ncbi:MAG TPA: hypothetical protein PLC76_05450 [Saprospiraceae bacterium]|nr:hypothetical protein [Saprospiraceae bacterium]QLH27979.1 MAG: hypothetical protein HWD63_00330 [Candidatus Parvibacillus calidus]MCC7148812.1 hypothetical protein [Saprospiraceae bacterium]HMZ25670.1 hypothetical protein [Saprospiraceae bacterium]HND74140.1 hypothetical protein [Saprospiraceae bacterium]